MKEFITSGQNPKIKQLLALRNKRDRDALALFLIEGYREILFAFNEGQQIRDLFISRELFIGNNEEALISQIEKSGARIFELPQELFMKVAYRERPDGLLALAPQQRMGLDALEQHLKTIKNPFLIVAESVEKPGNLGTILRSADGAGVSGVIICDRCTDIYNPNVVRASLGTLFTQPVVEAAGSDVLTFLKKEGFTLVAATPHTDLLYTDADLSKRIAIIVGTEQYGLSASWMKAADLQVRIPMRGKADSLNVSSATTLLLYEALRQRSDSSSR